MNTRPKQQKYDVEIGQVRKIINYRDGYLYEDPSLHGHWVVTLYKPNLVKGEVRIIAQWDSKRMANRQARTLRRATSEFLDGRWERGTRINKLKLKL